MKVKISSWIKHLKLNLSYKTFEVEADAVFGTVQESTSVVIGNIPHMADYRAWATENMYEMREDIKVS